MIPKETSSPNELKNKILEELKKVLISRPNNDEQLISLFDVSELLKKTTKQYDNMQSIFEMKMNCLLNNYLKINFKINDFNYDSKELRIKIDVDNQYYNIILSKEDNKLIITKSETKYDKQILNILGSELSNLYDEFLKYRDFIKQYHFNFKTMNSMFWVDICHYGVNIKDKPSFEDIFFELCANSYNNRYECYSRSDSITTFLKVKEEFLKKIYIKIEDCPTWSIEILQNMRKKQLKNEHSIPEINKVK